MDAPSFCVKVVVVQIAAVQAACAQCSCVIAFHATRHTCCAVCLVGCSYNTSLPLNAAAADVGVTVFLLLSVNTLAGVQSKVGQFLKEVVGTEYDPLAGPEDRNGASSYVPQPYVPFKGGSHVE